MVDGVPQSTCPILTKAGPRFVRMWRRPSACWADSASAVAVPWTLPAKNQRPNAKHTYAHADALSDNSAKHVFVAIHACASRSSASVKR